MTTRPTSSRLAGAALLSLAAALPLLDGCAPAVVAVGAAEVAIIAGDPRPAGVQLDDQSVELKVLTEAGTRWGSDIHLNVTSYNGIVLLTGEAPSTVIQDEITQLAKSAGRTRVVQNDMVIGPTADLGGRSNDTFITSKVKSRLLGDENFKAIYVKVVTERSVVYLMGIMTREQGEGAARIAATTSGVAKVVKVFEYTN